MNIKSKISALKDIKMKQIKQSLNINKGTMKTHVKLELDGKTIIDEDGHSILAGFAQELYLAMRGETDTLTTTPEKITPDIIPLKITSAQTSGGTRTRLNYVAGYGEYVGNNSLWIYGTGTGLDGNKYSIYSGDASSNYVIINTAWTGHEAEYGAISGGYAVSLLTTKTNIFPTYYGDQTMFIRLGYNATAVAITDNIPQIAPEITHGGTTYSAVTPDADNDRVNLTFTMTATNGTVGAITVSDVNMLRCDSQEGTLYLFARDLLSVPVVIPAGGSLTVTYTIRTTTDLESDNKGGFTQRLLEILRGLSVISNVLDINNITRTMNNSSTNQYGTFKAVYMPRNQPSRVSHAANTTPAWKFGIILGTGTAEPDPSDYYMATAIVDGSGSGQLKYWASFVDGYTEAATSRSFNVSRIVQNSSGSAIVVSELGLGVCCYSSSEHPSYSALIARHVLSAATPDNRITIADGEFCIITYTITIEV